MRRATLLWIVLAATGSGCGAFGYTGSARDIAPETLQQEAGWIRVDGVPLLLQRQQHDCGPTALAMVLRYWDPDVPVAQLLARAVDERVSAADLRLRARALGYTAFVLEGKVEDLVHEIEAGRPVIVGTAKPTATGAVAHYEVVIGFHKATRRVATIDPAEGHRANTFEGFLREWVGAGRVLIVVLPMSPDALDDAKVARPTKPPKASWTTLPHRGDMTRHDRTPPRCESATCRK